MITLLAAFFIAGAAYMAAQELLLQLDGALGTRLRLRTDALATRLRTAGAGAQSRPVVLLVTGMGIGAALAFLLSDSLLFTALGAALGAGMPWAYAHLLESRRIEKFCGQQAAVLDLLSGSLKSGQSLSQALQTVALETPQPAAGHFSVISQKLALGMAAEQALDELAQQMQGQACEEELRMLATSVSVTRATGGNLAEILGQLADTVRERARMRAEIDSLTAQGKLSGWIVGSLPFFILIALHFLDPALVAPMFSTTLGLSLLAAGVVLELLGAFLIKRIVSIDL